MRLPVIITAIVVIATGCSAPAQQLPPSPADTVQCDADGYADLIGQNEEIFARATFPAPMRIIRPGDAVTMDFRTDRVNFDLDASGTITRVWCG